MKNPRPHFSGSARLVRDAIGRGITHLDDPRFPPDLAVTFVKLAKGGSQAVIGVSGTTKKQKTVLHALGKASRYLAERELAGLRLRRIPKMTFVWDDSVEKAFVMDQLLKKGVSDD
ncbi:ribosome-binding factor A [bacterium]|nr:ribosome-binding factor A [bacterium]